MRHIDLRDCFSSGRAVVLVLAFSPAASAADLRTTSDLIAVGLPLGGAVMAWSRDDREGEWQLAKGVTTAMALTYGLKQIVDKERPNGDSHSFPSGHATAAFAGAGFIQQRYGWAAGAPAYAAAAFAAWSRVETDDHFAIDVVAGGLIGLAAAGLFTTEYNAPVSATLHYSPGAAQLLFSTSW